MLYLAKTLSITAIVSFALLATTFDDVVSALFAALIPTISALAWYLGLLIRRKAQDIHDAIDRNNDQAAKRSLNFRIGDSRAPPEPAPPELPEPPEPPEAGPDLTKRNS